jgi:hypothetical protein
VWWQSAEYHAYYLQLLGASLRVCSWLSRIDKQCTSQAHNFNIIMKATKDSDWAQARPRLVSVDSIQSYFTSDSGRAGDDSSSAFASLDLK